VPGQAIPWAVVKTVIALIAFHRLTTNGIARNICSKVAGYYGSAL